jgi:dolichol-phosphate mannosyltransferase
MKIGIVIPSYNEAESIGPLILKIREVIPEAEVMVVDDSVDLKTVDAVAALKLSGVTSKHRDQKGGRGSAILLGISLLLEAGCDAIVEMDADFSHPPEQLSEILAKAKSENLDLLIASRYLAASRIVNWPLSRRVFSKASNLLARTLLGVPVHDYTNGYRCYSRRAAELISQTCGKYGKGFISLSEILVNVYYTKKAPMKIGEIPTRFVNRVRGESSVDHREIKNALIGLMKIYGLKRQLLRE